MKERGCPKDTVNFFDVFLDMLKNLTLPALILVILGSSCSNTDPHLVESGTNENITYDSLLADSLGADDWGMKSYVMAFLKKGNTQSIDSVEAVRLQRAHLDNITRLAEEGMMVVAGPFYGNKGELRGIFVFNMSDTAEARELVKSDPAVKAGVFRIELVPWYSSASLQLVNEWHQRISKKDI